MCSDCNLKEDITGLSIIESESHRRMPAAGILLRVLAAALTFSQASAAPWKVEKCNGNAAPSSPLDLSSCCRWSGDSNGASMHPASASASCSDARASCGLAASPDGHARTLGLSASGVCAGAPLVRTGSCPGFTVSTSDWQAGRLWLNNKGINLISPGAFDDCGAT